MQALNLKFDSVKNIYMLRLGLFRMMIKSMANQLLHVCGHVGLLALLSLKYLQQDTVNEI